MSEVFKVHILSSNIRTCFFYLNDSDLRASARHGCAIKLTFGSDSRKLTYGCINLTPVSEVPSKSIGVTALYANKLGLWENDVVLVSYCNVDSVDSLEILPRKEEDYVILLSCKSILETYLLNQVSVVAEGQILPVYVFSNISIDVEIGKLNLPSGYGQLEKFTKITVLHPSEKPKNNVKKNPQTIEESDIQSGKHNFASQMYNQLSKILESSASKDQINERKIEETILKHLVNDITSKKIEYKILPSFLFPTEQYNKIQNKFIIVSNLDCKISCCDPHSVKILAKVRKVMNKKEDNLIEIENKKENLCLYTYVICLNNDDSNVAYCPPNIMKKLKLFGGSKITVEKVEPHSKIESLETSEGIYCQNDMSLCLWEGLANIKDKVRQTLITNFKYKHKINSLVVGEPGTGKTFLLTDIVNEFTSKFIFCKIVHCKSLRGKKIETLHKILTDDLRECSGQEPSVLVLDDLHALTYIDEDEGAFNRLNSERIVDLITEIILNFQEQYNISVICSAINITHLSAIVSQHGPRLFQNVLTIPDMSSNERNFALKCLINRKLGITKDCLVDLDKLSCNTKGYTIQDLNDLVEKAVFNCLLRNETEGSSTNVSQLDFDSALAELIPLNLRNVKKLKQNYDTKWEDVGGMREPKQVLLEVFSWPLKYPKILESCPLRLQRGVLLYGAPGTGKTMLAGALANKCGLNFISVKGPEILSKYIGASEEGVRNLFLQAERTQPCLLFFDEFDSLAPKRGHDNTGVTDRVVNQLLTQLDGVESLNGVWVLAATSRPDLLDPALLRPGRLDKMIFCDVPNQNDRLSILEILSQNLTKGEDVNLLEIAAKSEGYTGADLQAVLYNAQMSAIKEEKNSLGGKPVIRVQQNHLSKALTEVKPSLSQKENQRYKKIYDKFLNSRKRNFVENYEGVQRVTLA